MSLLLSVLARTAAISSAVYGLKPAASSQLLVIWFNTAAISLSDKCFQAGIAPLKLWPFTLISPVKPLITAAGKYSRLFLARLITLAAKGGNAPGIPAPFAW